MSSQRPVNASPIPNDLAPEGCLRMIAPDVVALPEDKKERSNKKDKKKDLFILNIKNYG